MLRGLHLAVLLGMIEPTRADGDVAVCRHPGVAIGMTARQLPVVRVAGIDIFPSEERPVWDACLAPFVAYPAATRASVAEDDGLGLVSEDDGMNLG